MDKDPVVFARMYSGNYTKLQNRYTLNRPYLSPKPGRKKQPRAAPRKAQAPRAPMYFFGVQYMLSCSIQLLMQNLSFVSILYEIRFVLSVPLVPHTVSQSQGFGFTSVIKLPKLSFTVQYVHKQGGSYSQYATPQTIKPGPLKDKIIVTRRKAWNLPNPPALVKAQSMVICPRGREPPSLAIAEESADGFCKGKYQYAKNSLTTRMLFY